MSPTIREAEPWDRDAVVALAPRLTQGVAPWRPPQAVLEAVTHWVESSLDNQDDEHGTVLVAEDDGTIAGFISVSEKKHWSGQTDAYIGELVVASEFEGRGFGSALVEGATEWSRQRGLERITLATGTRNGRARRLYESLGFEEEGVTLCASI
jgi:ribosomal protein S18 acetylase RimI-like enzyme